MKAKVIKTGEIVEVYHEPQHGQTTNIYKECVLVNGRMWPEDELDFYVKTSEAPEKIYVSNYSSGLTYNWHNERLAVNDIEYVRKDAIVEKACEYFRRNLEDTKVIDDYRNILVRGIQASYTSVEEFIGDFKRYMEGE
jgi:hypothetical protein